MQKTDKVIEYVASDIHDVALDETMLGDYVSENSKDLIKSYVIDEADANGYNNHGNDDLIENLLYDVEATLSGDFNELAEEYIDENIDLDELESVEELDSYLAENQILQFIIDNYENSLNIEIIIQTEVEEWNDTRFDVDDIERGLDDYFDKDEMVRLLETDREYVQDEYDDAVYDQLHGYPPKNNTDYSVINFELDNLSDIANYLYTHAGIYSLSQYLNGGGFYEDIAKSELFSCEVTFNQNGMNDDTLALLNAYVENEFEDYIENDHMANFSEHAYEKYGYDVVEVFEKYALEEVKRLGYTEATLEDMQSVSIDYQFESNISPSDWASMFIENQDLNIKSGMTEDDIDEQVVVNAPEFMAGYIENISVCPDIQMSKEELDELFGELDIERHPSVSVVADRLSQAVDTQEYIQYIMTEQQDQLIDYLIPVLLEEGFESYYSTDDINDAGIKWRAVSDGFDFEAIADEIMNLKEPLKQYDTLSDYLNDKNTLYFDVFETGYAYIHMEVLSSPDELEEE